MVHFKHQIVCDDLKKGALAENLNVKGPVRLPTKFLRITTRKAPNGEGTNTWDRFEMRVHKRLLDFITTDEVLLRIFLYSGHSLINYH